MGRSDLELLRTLLRLTFDDLLGREVSLQSSTALVGMAHVWAATHLDARLRALEFMLSV
jgi:DNA repair protein RecO (recombination protein O)